MHALNSPPTVNSHNSLLPSPLPPSGPSGSPEEAVLSEVLSQVLRPPLPLPPCHPPSTPSLPPPPFPPPPWPNRSIWQSSPVEEAVLSEVLSQVLRLLVSQGRDISRVKGQAARVFTLLEMHATLLVRK